MKLSLPQFSLWTVLMFPVVQYVQFLGLVPHFNSTLVYEILLIVLVVRFGLRWLQREDHSTRMSAVLSVGLLGLMTVQQLIWLPEFLRHGASEVFQSNFALTGLIPACLLLTGLSAARVIFSTRFYGFIFAAYAVAVSLGVSVNVRETGLTVIKFVNYASSEHFNYLNLADMFAFVAILLLSRLTLKPLLYFVTFLISLAILTATFSRTSLILFGIVFVVQLILNRSLRLVGIVGVLVTSVLAIVTFSTASFSAIQSSENYLRVSSLLADPSTDSSFVGRSDIAANRLSEVADHFWTGTYMAEWWSYGERGGYLHNILSYFDSYGAVVFVLLLLVLAITAQGVRLSPQGIGLVFIYAVMAVFFSRSYVWPYLWLAIGLIAGSRRPQSTFSETHVGVPEERAQELLL